MLNKTMEDIAREAEAAAAAVRKPVTSTTPITDAVYPKKRPVRKPAPAPKPRREPRGTSVAEAITPHAAASLVALKAELESARPKRKQGQR